MKLSLRNPNRLPGRYYLSSFMDIFNQTSAKAHAYRDCSFRNVGATIGVNNFFIVFPIFSVLFLFSTSVGFFAIFSVSIDLHAPAKSTMLTSFAALVYSQFIIEKRWVSFGGTAGQMKSGRFYCAYYDSLPCFLNVPIYIEPSRLSWPSLRICVFISVRSYDRSEIGNTVD